MAANTVELREKRAGLVAKARQIYETASADGRENLNTEEQAEFDKIMADADKIKSDIDSSEKAAASRDRLAAAEADLSATQPRKTAGIIPQNARGEDKPSILELSIRGETLSFDKSTSVFSRNTPEARKGFRNWLVSGPVSREAQEYAALQTDVDTSGGYLTTPESFVSTFLKNVDNAVFIRGLATKIVSNAQTTGVRKRTAKASTFAWGGELTTPTADTSLTFGKRTLSPHYMTGEILVSRDLLRASVMDVEMIVMDEMTRDAGELEEQAFISGNGSQQPLGLFTASSDGISTSRDVSTGNQTTSLTFDGLINAKYALKTQYRSRASWMFHRDGVKQIMTLKDGNGQYLWQPSVVAGQPDRILNLPLYESEWVPSTFTTGQYVGMLGDYSYYWIVDALLMDMQRLVEKYAETNQVAFIARRKTDGMPILEEAFVRVKLG